MSGMGLWAGIASAVGNAYSSNKDSGSSTSSSGGNSSSSSAGGLWSGLFNGILSGISASAKGSDQKQSHADAVDLTKQTGHQQRLSYQFEKELDEYNKDINKKKVYDAASSTYGKGFSSLDRFAPNYKTTYAGPTVRPGPSSPDY